MSVICFLSLLRGDIMKGRQADPIKSKNRMVLSDFFSHIRRIGASQSEDASYKKVAEIEAALQAQIDEQRAPTKASGVPWS